MNTNLAHEIDYQEMHIIELLRERDICKPFADDFAKIDKELKTYFKNFRDSVKFDDDHYIKISRNLRRSYDVPAEIKERYETKIEYTKIDIITL